MHCDLAVIPHTSETRPVHQEIHLTMVPHMLSLNPRAPTADRLDVNVLPPALWLHHSFAPWRPRQMSS